MPQQDDALFAAIARNGPAGVEAAIGAGADLNARQGYNHTALSRAVAKDSARLAGLLLERGADQNARSESGETPLHHARLASREVFDRLIAACADPNSADRIGRTPLHLAGPDKRFLTDLVRLLEAGADPNARTDTGTTPLQRAVSVPVIERLTTWRADPNAADKLGQTPLHLAVSDPDSDSLERFERVVRLINAGADPKARTNRQETPLHGRPFPYAIPLRPSGNYWMPARTRRPGTRWATQPFITPPASRPSTGPVRWITCSEPELDSMPGISPEPRRFISRRPAMATGKPRQ